MVTTALVVVVVVMGVVVAGEKPVWMSGWMYPPPGRGVVLLIYEHAARQACGTWRSTLLSRKARSYCGSSALSTRQRATSTPSSSMPGPAACENPWRHGWKPY